MTERVATLRVALTREGVLGWKTSGVDGLRRSLYQLRA